MRAQRVAAATAVIGLVSVCYAVGITAGSASTSDSPSVKAAPGPNVSETTITSGKDGSNTLGDKVKTDRTSSSKTRHARSSRLRAREVFSVGEKRNSLTLRVGTFNVRTARAQDDRSWLEQAAILVSWQFRNSARDARMVPRELRRGICGRPLVWSARCNASSAMTAISWSGPRRT